MKLALSPPLGLPGASPTATPLRNVWLLSVLVFLIGYAFEVLDFHHLYETRHFLLALLQLTLALWALIELVLLGRRETAIPLRGLRLALIAQVLIEASRYPLGRWLPLGQPQFEQLPGHFGLAVIYVPLNALVLLLISKLLIDALSFTERQRAAMLQRESETRLRAEEALSRSLRECNQAEAQVRSLRAQLERTACELTEKIPVGTYTLMLPPGGTLAWFSFMSRRFLELTGLDREAASDPLKPFACVHPDDYADWLKLNTETFATKRPFFGQCRIILKDRVRWITAESSPRELPDGAWIWEGVLLDITAQKDAEAALRQAHRELLAAEREQARQRERKHLLQDMHDGFGSQLATARIRMNKDRLSPGEGEALLGECLADLHLLVDTLGNTEQSLSRALADYRYRCERRLSQGPARLVWRLGLAGCPRLPERTLLQTLRILQEGLNNALKHAQASQILVEVSYQPEGQVVLSVTDDGVGLPAAITYGRGLSLMLGRARDIGASLAFERFAPGTRLVLTLPLSPAAPASAPSAGSEIPFSGANPDPNIT